MPFVPGRTPDLADLLHDGIRAALAMAFVSIPVCHAWLHKLSMANKKY
jgi:VanZ family protein